MFLEDGKYVAIEPGVELFVQDVGEGEPIVLLPGWTFSSEIFHKQVAHFKQTHRVIAIDPRSQGRSIATLHGNNYATHGSDVKKVLDSLEIKAAHFVGWSFGCLTIWEYVRQFGTESILSSVLVDLSAKPLSINHEEDWVEGPLDEIAGAYNAYTISASAQRDFITYYATEVMVQRDLTEEELTWILEQSLQTPYYAAAHLFASGMFSDYREELNLLSEAVPTLTIAAEHWAETAQRFVSKHAPQSQFASFGGHLMFWEYPEQFNEKVSSFLQR